jgi:elongator complex protein 2
LIWNKHRGTQYAFGYGEIGSLEGHTGSINYIASVALGSNSWLVTTASADGTIGVWKIALKEDGTAETTAIQSIKTLPKYMPLSFALTVPHPGKENSPDGPFILAVGGSFYNIDVFIAGADLQFKKGFTLPGHENWVRGMDFKRDHKNPEDVILASSAQDKFIRLWKFHHGKTETSIGSMAKDFSGKVYHMSIGEGESETVYSCTNTGFLVGHEDWVFTIFWKPGPEMKLLSTSADNSMAIWEYDEDAEMWSITAQVGEVSTTKGASTATGSAGGLWLGMWGPDGNSLLAIGKTGSWRFWEYDSGEDRWMGKVAITGHIRQASGVTWCPDGSYLLSTRFESYCFRLPVS